MDPKSEYTDDEIDQALHNAAFYHYAETLKQGTQPEDIHQPVNSDDNIQKKSEEFTLDSKACDLSLGTQQLLSLAYALLRKESRLIMLDEPTA